MIRKSGDTIHLTAPGGVRLDLALAAALPDASRAEVQRWIRCGAVLVSGRTARASDRPAAGEPVTVRPPAPQPASLIPSAIPLAIVYEDEDLLVVDKPAGMTVHPGAGTRADTLANALLAHCGSLSVIGGEERPGIVHRLDKETSGLLVVAKNDRAHRSLAAQIASKTAAREYAAIVWGNPTWEKAVVRLPIGRDPHHRTRMAVVAEEDGGRPAETLLDVVERLPLGCVLKAALRTGRTHQIRVHCAASGFPLVGDPVYGNHRSRCLAVRPQALQEQFLALQRQALHARRLSFTHPRTGEHLDFTAEPPSDWQAILEIMRAAGAEQ